MPVGKRKKLFVAMPFNSKYDSIFETVRRAAGNLDLELVQIGETAFTGSIIDRVRSEIEEADVMIAIATEENGNVYYEIGLAHCQRKPVLLLTSDPEQTKFDLRDHRAVVYDPNRPDTALDEITRILNSALNARNDPKAFLESAFGSAIDKCPLEDSYSPICRAMARIAKDAMLQNPVKLVDYHLLPNGDLAMTVKDYFEVSVRAVIDVNSSILRLKRED